MRWSQGQWSEERLIQATNETGRYYALPYGPSGTAPDREDVRAFELYFERLESAGLGRLKRPDVLIFKKDDEPAANVLVEQLGGLSELPFTTEDHPAMRELLSKSVIAVECENSLWKAKQMPAYGKALRPQKRLGGLPGLAKSAVLPTVIIKEEDRGPLLAWQGEAGVPIHVWHSFYDEAYGISLNDAMYLVERGLIQATTQKFQAPGGATTTKSLYKIYYLYAYSLASAVEEPELVAASITDKNGHILPYVRFHGGRLRMNERAIEVLDEAARAR
jgi:hypothetical protein